MRDRERSVHLDLTTWLDTLQTLGCIPRTPSPEPEIATPISAVTSREQKVRDLRVRCPPLKISITNQINVLQ